MCQSVKKYILGKDETLVFVVGAMDMGVFCMIEEKRQFTISSIVIQDSIPAILDKCKS